MLGPTSSAKSDACILGAGSVRRRSGTATRGARPLQLDVVPPAAPTWRSPAVRSRPPPVVLAASPRRR